MNFLNNARKKLDTSRGELGSTTLPSTLAVYQPKAKQPSKPEEDALNLALQTLEYLQSQQCQDQHKPEPLPKPRQCLAREMVLAKYTQFYTFWFNDEFTVCSNCYESEV